MPSPTPPAPLGQRREAATEDFPDSQAELRRLRADLRDLQHANSSLERDVQAARQELATIRSGILWHAVETFRRLRIRALPPGTRRDRALRVFLMGIDGCIRLGILRTIRTALLSPRSLLPALRAARSTGLPLNRQYQLWIEKHRLTPTQLKTIREEIRTFARSPVVSVLMPVFNIEAAWLHAAVDSVRAAALSALGALHGRRCVDGAAHCARCCRSLSPSIPASR